MRMALAAIADDRDFSALDEIDVGIGIVRDPHGVMFPRSMVWSVTVSNGMDLGFRPVSKSWDPGPCLNVPILRSSKLPATGGGDTMMNRVRIAIFWLFVLATAFVAEPYSMSPGIEASCRVSIGY